MFKSSFALTAIALTALFGFSSVQAQGVQTIRPDQQPNRIQSDQYGRQAIPKVEEHLNKVKQLAKQFENESKTKS